MQDLSIYNNNFEKLYPEEIYSYLFLENNEYSNIDLHSITFKNCIIKSIDFKKTVFANSDFDSSNIESCIFEAQSFQNSDIISSNFENCKFTKVSFKGATISNNTFYNCTFISCNFNHVTMSESNFINCRFEKIILRQSSTSLNTFSQCHWANSNLQGNFVYNLLIDSVFDNSSLNELILSSNFGITNDNLKSLGIDDSNLYEIQDKLINKKELLNVAIIELNSNKNCYENSIVFCINLFLTQLQNNVIVRSEEIRFVELVLSYLITSEEIAPITIIQLLSLIDTFNKNKSNNIAINKAKTNINIIYNTLLKSYHDYVENLNESLLYTYSNNSNIKIKFVFEKRPSIETCELLSSLQQHLSISSDSPKQIKTEFGSFIEWISAPDNIIKCLQLLVSIIGVAINVIHKKPKNSKKYNSDKEVSQSNVTNNQNRNNETNIVLNIPNIITKQINQVQTEKDISNTINVFVINDMTIQNNYHGFNKQNIKNIECYYE